MDTTRYSRVSAEPPRFVALDPDDQDSGIDLGEPQIFRPPVEIAISRFRTNIAIVFVLIFLIASKTIELVAYSKTGAATHVTPLSMLAFFSLIGWMFLYLLLGCVLLLVKGLPCGEARVKIT